MSDMSESAVVTMPDKNSFSLAKQAPMSLFIMNGEGGRIAEFKPDGTLEVTSENASEAAAVFWSAVRGHVEASFAACLAQKDNTP